MISRLPAKQLIVAMVMCLALLLIATQPASMTPNQTHVLGIILVTLALWATSVVPSYLASLIFFTITLIFGLAAPDLVFSGFTSAAIWLIVSGFVIGSAIGNSGLGNRLAAVLDPMLTSSYTRLIGGLMLAAMLLGFLMPSSIGRAVVLVPIGMALADRIGFALGSNGRAGIAVVLTIACNMPSFAILPSNIPNMVLVGASETIHGVHFGYMDYLALHYPVLGILKAIITVMLVVRLFPATIDPVAKTAASGADTGTTSAAQFRVAIILLITLAFWMTDSVHGINAAWIGLATACILLLPGIGIVSPANFKTSVDFGMLLFVVGALAVGTLVNATGLGSLLGSAMTRILQLSHGADMLNFLSLSLMTTIIGVFATMPGVPAVLTPMAPDLAAQTGFDLQAVLMTQVVGFSTIIFPYQVAPLIVAMQLAGERLGNLVRVIMPLAAVTILVLLPLDYFWWKFLGWI
ncbi:SLC13 family permease [Aureimonas fodinaquatilis]|uniref:SLC13 family permease n=2 Tax=Aureimonas fodinaquatilis TaxID=2565783 RepID=A0A5B0DW65_9HYPH|nr:SLC13 family permease [Aureimonas fodinaquatilis]